MRRCAVVWIGFNGRYRENALIARAHAVERAVEEVDVRLEIFDLPIGPGDEYDAATELLFKRRKDKRASASRETRHDDHATARFDFRFELLKLAAFKQASEDFSVAGQRR